MDENFPQEIAASNSSSSDIDDFQDNEDIDKGLAAFENTSAFKFFSGFTFDVSDNKQVNVDEPSGNAVPSTSNESLKIERLRPEEIRWFYYNNKKKTYKPMIGCDSLRVEDEWRLHHYEKKEARRVPVQGGMYEADVQQLQCFPIYWSTVDLKSRKMEGETIVRGSWFFRVHWHPLNDILADTIEKEHKLAIQTVADSGLKHTIQLENCHIEWLSEQDIYFYKDATGHKAFRKIVQKLGVSKVRSSAYHLSRGYKIDASATENYAPINSIVFVTHGIGAKSDRYRIIRNTTEFRNCFNRIHPNSVAERIEFIPVEWRSKVSLDNGLVTTITLPQSPGVRKFINNAALDILYYTTPLYRRSIMTALRTELNRIYSLFKEKNPKFKGKIVVLAHSLGCVILHDILIDWRPPYEEESRNPEEETHLNFKVDILFCVGSPLGMFLCLRGFQPSLTRPVTQDIIIPTTICPRLFNVFHPADPIAYRIEPLLYPHYSSISPVQICSREISSVSNKNLISEPNTTALGDSLQDDDHFPIASIPQCVESQPEFSLPVSMVKPSKIKTVSKRFAGGAARLLHRDRWKGKKKGKDSHHNISNASIDNVDLSINETSVTNEISSTYRVGGLDAESNKLVKFNEPKLTERLDFQLPTKFTAARFTFAAFTSHTSYWSNADLALFVFNQIKID